MAVVLPKVADSEHVPGGVPFGRRNQPLNEPPWNVLVCASETIEQEDAIIYPKDTCSPSGSDQPEPLAEILALADPKEGLLLMLPVMDARSPFAAVTKRVVE